MTPPVSGRQRVVLDTNVVLDLFLFGDAASLDLRDALQAGDIQWIATAHMRAELLRVLDYPSVRAQAERFKVETDQVLAAFDRWSEVMAPAAPAQTFTCSDPDDQPFVDLAVAHGVWLISKDKAVLQVARALRLRGAAARVMPPREFALAQANAGLRPGLGAI